MKRNTFLAIAGGIGLAVGIFALLFPGLLLESKGVAPGGAANLWVCEVGVLLIATGMTALLVRNHDDSPTLKAVFAGNLIVQLGLLPIEPIGYQYGIITRLSGIAPNTVLHLVLACAFGWQLLRMRRS